MSDQAILYIFLFLMVSNLILSLAYAFGTAELKEAARKAFRK